jgi:hypothetical protein
MIQLSSFGDQIVSGDYRRHSCFSRAANFVNGDSLLCCVDDSIGPGPLNLVIGGISLQSIRSVVIDESGVLVDGESIDIEPTNKYCSKLIFEKQLGPDTLKRNIDFFGECLSQHSNPLSLAFLIDSAREQQLHTSFEIELVNRFRVAARQFTGPDYIAGVQKLRGMGYGLTPAGDDFIAGGVAALYIMQTIFQKDNSDKISQICNRARGENVISNSLLRCCASGHFPYRMRELLMAVLLSGRDKIYSQAIRLLEIGATSGADWGVGLFTTLKSELEEIWSRDDN